MPVQSELMTFTLKRKEDGVGVVCLKSGHGVADDEGE